MKGNDPVKYQYLGEAFCRFIRFTAPISHHMLDVGCGHGIATAPMRQLCERMTLVDTSAYAIDEQSARWSRDDNVTVFRGDIQSLRGLYDFIYYFLSLHHISDTEAELRRVRELLSPEGFLAICEVVPHPTKPFHGSEEVPYDGFVPFHLMGMLQDNGFRVVKTDTIGNVSKNHWKYEVFAILCKMKGSIVPRI